LSEAVRAAVDGDIIREKFPAFTLE
jgi:hypothetical protein